MTSHCVFFFHLISLLIVLFTVQFTDGQGVGGGGGGGGAGGFGGGSSCTTEKCRRDGIIAGSVIGGFFGLICLCGLCFCCAAFCWDRFNKIIRKCRSICSCKCWRKTPYQSDKNEIKLTQFLLFLIP